MANRISFLVGDKASIPCNVTRHASIRDITIVMWYKDNISHPIYTLDARDGDVSQATRLLTPEFDKRTYFDVSINQPSLFIDPVQLKDNGIYTCRADFRSSRTFTQLTYVNVIGKSTYFLF